MWSSSVSKLVGEEGIPLMPFDLLTTVAQGGCSAKLPAAALAEALAGLPKQTHPDLLVDIAAHDDAGVYRIALDLALVQTVDFFPPVCSDPFDFGRIAAANALSDVYAMGGEALTAMNIVMFPSAKIPLDVLRDILDGGQQKVAEAGCVIVGGHTIDDDPPKYGLSVTGAVHPDRIVRNSGVQAGDALILTKALGTGAIIAGRRIGQAPEIVYQAAIDSMKQLNRSGGRVMRELGVRGGTDVTGFGLLGHALKMARGSGVSIRIKTSALPLLPGAYELVDLGCIPGAAFRNQEFVEQDAVFAASVDYSRKMLALDPQTSGGLLMAVPASSAEDAIRRLRDAGYPHAVKIGDALTPGERALDVV